MGFATSYFDMSGKAVELVKDIQQVIWKDSVQMRTHYLDLLFVAEMSSILDALESRRCQSSSMYYVSFGVYVL